MVLASSAKGMPQFFHIRYSPPGMLAVCRNQARSKGVIDHEQDQGCSWSMSSST